MNHIEENNIEVRQLIQSITDRINRFDFNNRKPKILSNFQQRYNHYKDYPYSYVYSYGMATDENIFVHILHTLYRTIELFQNIENNYQYVCLKEEKFFSNKRGYLYNSLDTLLQNFNDVSYKIFFPKLIKAYIPIEYTKKVNWTKHHTRAKEDEYELLIRDNLPEFLKHSKIEYLKKANYLHVINFMKKKYNLSIGQEIAKVILKYLKDDLEKEQDDE